MGSIFGTHVETQIGHTAKKSQKNDEFFDEDLSAWMEKNRKNYPILKKTEEQNIFRSLDKETNDLWAVISKFPITDRAVEMIKNESKENEEEFAGNELAFRVTEVIMEIINELITSSENGNKDAYRTIEIETRWKPEELFRSWNEIIDYFTRIKRIEEEIILRNLGLVMKISRRLIGRNMPFPDLFQEGVLGLIKALWRFEIKKGYKFSTYATWWIKQSAMRSIADKAGTMRTPIHIHDLLSKISKATKELTQELGRAPKSKEVAERIKVPLEKVKEAKLLPQEPVSMSDPYGEDDKSPMGDFIVDTKTDDHVENINQVALQKAVREVLKDLPKKERAIIEMRFGLTGGTPQTLEETGSHFKVTRERIRQLEKKAIKKIKHPSRIKLLKEFSGGKEPLPEKVKKIPVSKKLEKK